MQDEVKRQLETRDALFKQNTHVRRLLILWILAVLWLDFLVAVCRICQH